MPFVVYRMWPPEAWEPMREIELSGQKGPLAKLIRAQVNGSVKPFGWKIPEAEILRGLGFSSRQEALVLESNAGRQRVSEVSGYSDETFTVILPRFSSVPKGDPLPSYRPMYLRGGTVDQTWTWVSEDQAGEVRMRPGALEFFLQSVQNGVHAAPVQAALPLTAPEPAAPPKKSVRGKDRERDPLYYELRQQLNEMFPPAEAGKNGGAPAAEQSEDLHVDLDEVLRRGKSSVASEPPKAPLKEPEAKPAEKGKQSLLQWAKTRWV